MLKYDKRLKKALNELIELGFAAPDFNPLESMDAHIYEDGFETFIIYRVLPSHVKIDFIYVNPEARGKNAGKRILSRFKQLVRSKQSWPKLIRADILSGNDRSINLFREFATRSYEVELYL